MIEGGCDRPETEPTEDIRVTPEMIEVGMHEYSTRWIGLRDADDEIAKEMLAAAYRAMFRLMPVSESQPR